MITIRFTDRSGVTHTLSGESGTRLMELLRDQPEGVAAICGGIMACGTCRVLIPAAWRQRLAPQSADEIAVLQGIPAHDPDTRLSCQIVLTPELEGLPVKLAPDN